MSDSIIEVGSTDFDERVLRASFDQPVLVDFWATWCGPCLRLAPVLAQLAGAVPSERLAIAKVDTDEHPDLAQRYNVRGIPFLLLFKLGEPVAVIRGRTAAALQTELAEHL